MSFARDLFDYPLLRLGQAQLTVWSVATFVVLTVLLVWTTAHLQRVLIDRLLPKASMQIGVRQSVATIIRYFIIAVGFLLILETLGIDLTTLTVVAGAVGIGVGFGLQNIAANIVSGFIILFERPVKVGDRIEVGAVAGTVTEIRARSTTVLTNDNIAIIIPNSKILNENVVNWSYTGDSIRFRIPVGVAFDSDVRLVERLLIEVAKDNTDVLISPKPTVRFSAFGDSALEFQLLAWTTTHTHRRGLLVSTLNFAIFEKFAAHGVRIPFPQRDVHLLRERRVERPVADTGGDPAPHDA
jgi:small-conductance mechanosensitive channel